MNNEHPDECKCSFCEQGVEKALEHQQAMIKQYGWVAHYLTDHDRQSPTGCNVHTHGVMESYNHPDFQCVVPIPPTIVHSLISTLVNRVKAGERFEAGKRYDKVVLNMDVTFIEATETGRTVLRLILPSANGSLDPATMDQDEGNRVFREQFGIEHAIEGGFELTKLD